MERGRSGRLIVEQRRNLGLSRLLALFEKRRGERLFALAFELEMERHVGLGGGLGKSGFGLGMPAAHHGGVEPLFDHLASAGFDHGLAPQEFLAMGLLVEVALDAVGLLGCQQTGVRMGVSKFQTRAGSQYFVDGSAPFLGKGFDPLSRHLTYSN